MTILDWAIIIAKIIILIAGGLEKGGAVTHAADLFGVDENEILKHGGF